MRSLAVHRHAVLAALELLLPPPQLTPSEWAERYRYLPRGQTSMPGPWRNRRSPYLVGIMDAVANARTRWVVVKKCAQAGVSEAFRNVIGWAATQEPDPFLYVMPTEDAVRKIFRERVKPMLQDTPVLRALLTPDVTLRAAKLTNGFALSSGWAGSPQALATDPARFVLFDETDKYPEYAGREADPVSLGSVRTETYQELARLLLCSTPTTRLGVVHETHEQCEIRRTYRVPCPHCGRFQALAWDRVKWPAAERAGKGVLEGPGFTARHAARVQMRSLAWYECVRCDGKWTDEQRKAAIVAALDTPTKGWAHESLEMDDDGNVVGEEPEGQRIGFHVIALMVPWVSMSKLAAEKIRAGKDPKKLMHFRNSRLGEVFEDQVETARPEALRLKVAAGHPEGIIPKWAKYLLATADVQQDHVWYVLRAWGHGYRSRLIREGRVETLETLADVCLGTSYPIEGGGWGHAAFLAIDAGYRTEEVYRFCLEEPARRFALKGHGGRTAARRPILDKPQTYTPKGEKADPDLEVLLRVVDTQEFQDRLAAFMGVRPEDPQAWELHTKTTEDYIHQLCSMHKVMIRTPGGGTAMRWQTLAAHRANHLRDCEVYQVAAAEIARVWRIPSPEQEAEAAQAAEAANEGSTDGWVDQGRTTPGRKWL